MKKLVEKRLSEIIEVHQKMLSEQTDLLLKIGDFLVETLLAGGAVYLCGNGGSAADAQHVATELVGRFLKERRALSVIALTTNTSLLTALGNDYAFSKIFSRQVEASLKKEDLLVGISTSGKSENILQAVEEAKKIGARTLAFTGTPGEPLASMVDLAFKVPSSHTPYIQEGHLTAWHILCDLVEQKIGEGKAS